LLDIEVTKGSRNEPKIQLSQKGDLLLYRIGGKQCKVTLSHTREIAMAVVAVLE
ncbi:MAG: holo-[acyl-carrier-protein] synthase, partial [Rhodobacterales bacterium]|nr:holo-[acyl-carrier-protein] synthase [Rhodobacterales bacterium]